MGKRIDDLPLDDSPITREPDAMEGDVRATQWYAFVREVEDLRESGDYAWAEETLAGIQETVERTKRVTPGQERALFNILSAERPSRRYEGYGRRGR